MLNKTEDFIAQNSDLLYDLNTVPTLYYENDVHYRKGWFNSAKRDCSAIGYLEQPWEIPDAATVKRELKASKVGLKRGDLFVLRATPVGYEIIPGRGIVASNVYGRVWNAEDLDFLLGQPNVKGLIFHNNFKGTINAQTDTSGQEVQTLWHRYDIDGRPFPV